MCVPNPPSMHQLYAPHTTPNTEACLPCLDWLPMRRGPASTTSQTSAEVAHSTHRLLRRNVHAPCMLRHTPPQQVYYKGLLRMSTRTPLAPAYVHVHARAYAHTYIHVRTHVRPCKRPRACLDTSLRMCPYACPHAMPTRTPGKVFGHASLHACLHTHRGMSMRVSVDMHGHAHVSRRVTVQACLPTPPPSSSPPDRHRRGHPRMPAGDVGGYGAMLGDDGRAACLRLRRSEAKRNELVRVTGADPLSCYHLRRRGGPP